MVEKVSVCSEFLLENQEYFFLVTGNWYLEIE